MPYFHIIWTIALLLVFVAIICWAWSSQQRTRFEDAAAVPFKSDPLEPDEEARNG